MHPAAQNTLAAGFCIGLLATVAGLVTTGLVGLLGQAMTLGMLLAAMGMEYVAQ